MGLLPLVLPAILGDRSATTHVKRAAPARSAGYRDRAGTRCTAGGHGAATFRRHRAAVGIALAALADAHAPGPLGPLHAAGTLSTDQFVRGVLVAGNQHAHAPRGGPGSRGRIACARGGRTGGEPGLRVCRRCSRWRTEPAPRCESWDRDTANPRTPWRKPRQSATSHRAATVDARRASGRRQLKRLHSAWAPRGSATAHAR